MKKLIILIFTFLVSISFLTGCSEQHIHEYVINPYDAVSHNLICSCGHVKNTSEHTFGSWYVVTNSTEEEKGLSERYCITCGYRQSKEDEVLTHNHQYINW